MKSVELKIQHKILYIFTIFNIIGNLIIINHIQLFTIFNIADQLPFILIFYHSCNKCILISILTKLCLFI